MFFRYRVDRVSHQTQKLAEIHAAVNARFVSQFGNLPKTKNDELIEDHNSMLEN